jgi:hypothetical protein
MFKEQGFDNNWLLPTGEQEAQMRQWCGQKRLKLRMLVTPLAQGKLLGLAQAESKRIAGLPRNGVPSGRSNMQKAFEGKTEPRV